MATLVVIESESGTLQRYETSPPKFVRTHGCTYGKWTNFTAKIVEDFRLMPSDDFKVEPPPEPTGSPSGAGEVQLPCDVEARAA